MMTFREALLSRIGAPGQPSLKSVCEQAKVSYEQLKKVRQRENGSTNVDDAVKIARVFGLSLDEFLADTLIEDRSAVARLYSKLSDDERQILLDLAKARAAQAHEAS